MNSIFFRIYAGLVFAMVLVSLLAYAGLEVINGWRAAEYRERMARGTFYLMARGVQRQETAEDEQRWLQVLGRLMGADLDLMPAREAPLDRHEHEAVSRGQVVMQLDEARGYADIYYRIPDDDRYLHTRMNKVSEQQARATALLVLDELARYPVQRWDTEFERIRDHFGFPLARVDFHQLRLDREQLQRLERREVVLALDESGSRQQSAVHVYAPIGNTGQVLVMGPLTLFDRQPVQLLVAIGLVGLCLMGLATYLLVRPLQARLHRLGLAVEQVGQGHFDVRAEEGSEDAIGELARTFNGMTTHIQRLIEAQREMTRAVSHELRTPVARLRFGLEMMADTADHAERQARLEELDRDIDQLDDLIDEILTFARLEEGTPTLEFGDVSLLALMHRIRNELQPIGQDVRIEIDADGVPAHVEASERYLHRMLQNLVTNAMRYARARVRMRAGCDGERVWLEVEDDGPGIPASDRERIFKPFARLDESRQRKSGGYGLGLSIVQRIADWHGGRVAVTDGELGGALFRFTWPRERVTNRHMLAVRPE